MADPAPDDLIPLTPVVFHILVALSGAVRHGYDVAREIEEKTGGTIRMGPGTLYGSLRRMQGDGLIAEAEDPGREGAHTERRRYYRITPLGREVLQAETARLGRAVELARTALARQGLAPDGGSTS